MRAADGVKSFHCILGEHTGAVFNQKQRTQPEAVKKCWQQAASRRTKMPTRCINKNIKTTNIVTEEGEGWTAGRHRGDNCPL